ncbi:alpha-L-rhamnosidase-related protein [Paenibacillus agaridevorans]|uniref:alpha-L-rhamnosidase-related protein n=1 Tax=Paenibacillus agaridevorans TaxID=171404 RepID=UPI000D59E6B0|nr:family 78 glycoside hydrolase catalytic domain [Paenibacillus agaridevorans]
MTSTSNLNHFRSAKPIWPKEMEKEKNITAGFRGVATASKDASLTLHIAASTLYRCYINGNYVGHGPARGPHGHYRVDVWDLSKYAKEGDNLIAIEVAGYNINSYYVLDQPSFLQAEVQAGKETVLATGGDDGFEATILKERVQKAQRFSFQRTFVEAYSLQPGFDRWRVDGSISFNRVACMETVAKTLISRGVPMAEFTQRYPLKVYARGEVIHRELQGDYWRDRSLTGVGPQYGGFEMKDLTFILSDELADLPVRSKQIVQQPHEQEDSVLLATHEFGILDMGINRTGFIGGTVRCSRRTLLYVTFDEVLREDDVDHLRFGCVNALRYELEPGTYRLETFEPYTLRYMKWIAAEGECEVSGIYMREYANADAGKARFRSGDERLNAIFEAGRETFRQNVVDLFMDCPSRERAGWLCDSFFMGRAAFNLTGETKVERAFFENYLLPDRFPHLPDGMLPMCYPADHNDGVFIPNWSLWFVIELEEYLERSGDRQLIDAMKPRILELFDYFERFKNEDGLLESLESWVFLEWSKANDFVQDVNYPTNMLYAASLAAAGRLYQLPDLLNEAEKVHEVIRGQSFDGEFFIDNAVRLNGSLVLTRNRSEICQYYAFYFGTADPDSSPELWNTLLTRFGPSRNQTNTYPDVHEANAFIGNYLRLELLARYGYVRQAVDESADYLHYMVERTGTLWENDGDYASCNHGFASHVVHSLIRDVLGIYRIDPIAQTITLRFCDLEISYCEGVLPLGDDAVCLEWSKVDGRVEYQIDAPPDYKVVVENLTGLPLHRRM